MHAQLLRHSLPRQMEIESAFLQMITELLKFLRVDARVPSRSKRDSNERQGWYKTWAKNSHGISRLQDRARFMMLQAMNPCRSTESISINCA
jgi:hypothetical protein